MQTKIKPSTIPLPKMTSHRNICKWQTQERLVKQLSLFEYRSPGTKSGKRKEEGLEEETESMKVRQGGNNECV